MEHGPVLIDLYKRWTREAPGASFTPTANVTLYAKWADVEYTIAYDANGATSGTAPASQTNCQYYTTYTLASNTGNLAKTGYNFTGWYRDAGATSAWT